VDGPYGDIQSLYSTMTQHISSSLETVIALEPQAIQAAFADKIVYVHVDLRPRNILIHNGRLSGVIDWEDSGWLPQHWQAHVILKPHGTNFGEQLKSWHAAHFFAPPVMDAYERSTRILEFTY